MDVFDEPIGIEKLVFLAGSLVFDEEMDVFQQERFFLQVVINGVPFEIRAGENRMIRFKPHEGSVLFRIPDHFEGNRQLAAVFKTDMVNLP